MEGSVGIPVESWAFLYSAILNELTLIRFIRCVDNMFNQHATNFKISHHIYSSYGDSKARTITLSPCDQNGMNAALDAVYNEGGGEVYS